MRQRRHISLICLAFGLMTLAACATPEEREEKKQPKEQPAEATPALTLTPEQQETLGLTTAQTVRREVRPVLESFGRVVPRFQGRVQVVAPVSGRVSARSVSLIPPVGVHVRTGQLLAEVEQTYTASEHVQLAVGAQGATGAAQEAKAALEAAASEYKRSRRLFEAKIVSRKRVEEAKAAWLQAQGRFETARHQEASYRGATATGSKSPRRFPLTAPIDGEVIQVDLTAGQQVDTTTPLLVIADLSTVWVEAPVFESDLILVDQESPAQIRVLETQQPAWMGTPVYAGRVVDPLKRTASLVYAVANPDGRLALGMSVTVAVPRGSPHQAVMVPEAALLENGNGKGLVYVRRSPTSFSEEAVTIGDRQDGFVAISGPVTTDDEVVVTGAPELFGALPGRLSTEE